MNYKLLLSRLVRHTVVAFTLTCLFSCASLVGDKNALPDRETGSESLVVLNLYRMNHVIGTDVEATFRLVNTSTGVLYPRIEMFPNGRNVGSLKLVEVPPGEYKVKYVEFRSIGQGVIIRLDCEQETKQFPVGAGTITYIGNVGIDNGNRDFFSQKYDLVRMDKSKVDSDLEYLKGSNWREESEWLSQSVVLEDGIFPEVIRNTL